MSLSVGKMSYSNGIVSLPCRAHGGDDHGSTYLQAFSTYLRAEYLERPLDRIYLMVKQHMRETKQVCLENLDKKEGTYKITNNVQDINLNN